MVDITYFRNGIKNIVGQLRSDKGQLLLYSVLSVVLFFGMLFIPSYATDTYATFMDPTVWEYMLYDNGRITIGLIYLIVSKYLWHIPKIGIICYECSYILAVIFLTLSLNKYACRVNQKLQNKVWSVLFSFLVLVNPFCIEYFLFVEMGAFFFALFCVVEAFEHTVQYWECKQKKRLVLTFFWLLLAVFTYQALVGMYVVLCLPYILWNASSIKKIVLNNVLVAFFYGVSLSCAYIVTHFLFHSIRLGEGMNILGSILPTIRMMKEIIFDPFYHLPNNYILYEMFVVVVICLTYLIIYCRRDILVEGARIAYLFLGCFVVGFFPFFVGVTTTSGVAPRTIYPFGGVFGILILYTVIRIKMLEHFASIPKIMWLIKSFVLVVSISEYLIFTSVLIDQYQCNQTDQYICQMIGDRIRNYEENTGMKIEKISFYKDSSEVWGIDGTYQNGLIIRAHAVGWSELTSINYYLDTCFDMGTPEQNYIDYFAEKNWNFYSDEQLIFDGDTLHLCIY